MSTPAGACLNYALRDVQNVCAQTKVGIALKSRTTQVIQQSLISLSLPSLWMKYQINFYTFLESKLKVRLQLSK